MTNYENLRNKKQKKYIKKLKAENALLQFKLNGANGVIARQIDYIATLNRQLEQQDLYMNRYMEELAVVKRMYRDDLINNFSEKQFKQDYECNFVPEQYPEWESNTSYTGREKVMYNGKVCYPSSQLGIEPTEIGI